MKKKKILVISGAAMLAMFSFAAASMALKPSFSHIAMAEGEEADTEAIAEQAAEKTTNKFKQIWESYLLPAVLSINIGTIVATITSIVLAIKNFRNHKSYREEVKGVIENVVGLSKQMVDYSLKLANKEEKIQNLLNAMRSAEDTANKQISLINEEKESFENLKGATLGLINLEIELAKINPEFVKSGIAVQLVELKNQLIKNMK